MHLRPLEPSEYPLLREFTRLAIYVPEGQPAPPDDLVDTEPQLRLCWEGFGDQPGDTAVCAVEGDEIVGIAWARVHRGDVVGYGYVDGDTPEIDVAVAPGHQGKGVGSALLPALLTALYDGGRRRASLSVDKGNRARSLYERLGFAVVREGETDLVMVADL